MAARYATVAFWYHRTGDGKDVFVGAGALRDSTDAAVTQNPGLFQSVKLTDKELGSNLSGWRNGTHDHHDDGP
jgi:hypothetical protein